MRITHFCKEINISGVHDIESTHPSASDYSIDNVPTNTMNKSTRPPKSSKIDIWEAGKALPRICGRSVAPLHMSAVQGRAWSHLTYDSLRCTVQLAEQVGGARGRIGGGTGGLQVMPCPQLLMLGSR